MAKNKKELMLEALFGGDMSPDLSSHHVQEAGRDLQSFNEMPLNKDVNAEQTKNKLSTQPRTELRTISEQTINKLRTKNIATIETKNKLSTQPRTELRTISEQTTNKLRTNSSFSQLVGLQKKIIEIVYRFCRVNGEKTTDKISLEFLASNCKASTAVVQVTTRRLISKGVLTKFDSKEGRGGWTRYSLPEIVYKALLKATDMAKQDRNQWYKDNVIILSPHAYSREKNPDGTLKVTPEESERLIAEFKEAVKNDHYAESRIKIAKDRIDRYYKDQEDFRMFSEGNFLDDPEGLAEALKQWEYQNSPFLYYDAIHNPGNLSEGESELVNKKMDYDRLPAYAPKKPEHYDEGFKEILADPDLLALYNHLSSYMRQAMEMFPPNASANVGNDFFVRMKSSVWEQFVANGYKPLSGNSFLTDAVALKHNYEFIDQLDELGNPLRKLSYPQLLDVDAEILNYKKLLSEPGLTKEDKKIYEDKLKELQREYTLDLKKTMELFIHMVENYKHNAEVVDQAQLQLYLVNQAKEDIGKGGYKTGGLKTTQTVVDYTIGASLFDDFRAEPDQYKKGEFWEDHIFTNLDLTGSVSYTHLTLPTSDLV